MVTATLTVELVGPNCLDGERRTVNAGTTHIRARQYIHGTIIDWTYDIDPEPQPDGIHLARLQRTADL